MSSEIYEDSSAPQNNIELCPLLSLMNVCWTNCFICVVSILFVYLHERKILPVGCLGFMGRSEGTLTLNPPVTCATNTAWLLHFQDLVSKDFTYCCCDYRFLSLHVLWHILQDLKCIISASWELFPLRLSWFSDSHQCDSSVLKIPLFWLIFLFINWLHCFMGVSWFKSFHITDKQ
jgi:hypothetical protein